jgi:alpha-D-xyloside xylohydrolase
MFRVHGTGAGKELWAFPADIQKTLLAYDQLRYRLLPYLYSMSWDVTHNRGTFMRALAMDFRPDTRALKVADQYMFGRALLVSPVVQAGVRARAVYLPAGTDWYDFWTGKRLPGGQVVPVVADLGRIPLHVRAGSILPLGPVKPYADAPSDAPLEIRIYPGRDGAFELYDDEGDGFAYEQGRYALVRFTWRDSRRVLEIGARRGNYPGMRQTQRLKLVCGGRTEAPAATAVYSGAATRIALPACAA